MYTKKQNANKLDMNALDNQQVLSVVKQKNVKERCVSVRLRGMIINNAR